MSASPTFGILKLAKESVRGSIHASGFFIGDTSQAIDLAEPDVPGFDLVPSYSRPQTAFIVSSPPARDG